MIKFVLFLIWCNFVLLAKHYLFKDCEQNGFCKRNIEYGSHKLESKTNDYLIVDFSQTDSDDAIYSGSVSKKVGDIEINFPFEVSILKDESLRFTLTEDRVLDQAKPSSKRFKAAEHVLPENLELEKSANVHLKDTKESITLVSGGLKVVFYKLFKIDFYVNDELEVSINKDYFLNIEHQREQKDNAKHLLPEERDYNMFSDDFKDSRNDKLPLGPESVGLDFNFVGYSHAYGIPEHSSRLSLQSETYRLYNVDIFEYEVDSNLPMYGSIPFLLASKPTKSVGLFWINSADTYIDIKKLLEGVKSHWMSENGVLDFILFHGNNPAEVNKKYAEVTGYTALPQLFALGYHQCRWNYNDQKDVLDIHSLFDKHHIPYDTLWLDIEYTTEKRYFTWNTNFPDPNETLGELDRTGRNLVIIIDPHIKTGYEVSNHLVEEKLTIKNSNNDTFYGHCWPGESVWVDSFNPGSQVYWDKLHELSLGNQIFFDKTNIHLWNDMNEISVFDGPETSSPKDNLQFGDYEERSVHNLNGRKFHELTYNSLAKRLEPTNRQRPFVLTRSFFAGLQKTAAMWTGDNQSKWEYLKLSIPMVLNNGVAGMPFAGADVGGFFGNPSKELLTRWYQTGLWYPFFRAHAHIDTRRREPWVPGEPYTSIIRDAISLRYSLLPEFYNAFRESSVSGLPILKPLFYENPKELLNFEIDDEFFLGNSGILVKPVTEEGVNEVTVYFPDDEIYYEFSNGNAKSKTYRKQVTVSVGLEDLPMYLKGGSIVSRKMRYRRSSKLMENDPYTLTIAPNSKQTANGSLYVDDYETFGYSDGQYLLTHFNYDNSKIRNRVQNWFSIDNKIEKIILLNVQATKVELEGNPLHFEAIDGDLIIKVPNLRVNENWEISVTNDLVRDEL